MKKRRRIVMKTIPQKQRNQTIPRSHWAVKRKVEKTGMNWRKKQEKLTVRAVMKRRRNKAGA